jgi:gamma-glutamylaminecyclotransferase
MTTELIFVYGTLKEGLCNAAANQGRRVPGRHVTEHAWPLMIVVQGRWPWLLPRRGEGHRVAGELYEVDAAALARMDALERVDEPGQYQRHRIAVLDDVDGTRREAWVYFGTEEGYVARGGGHAGPLDEYRLEHQECHVPFGE